jgi:hypothetical protein
MLRHCNPIVSQFQPRFVEPGPHCGLGGIPFASYARRDAGARLY